MPVHYYGYYFCSDDWRNSTLFISLSKLFTKLLSNFFPPAIKQVDPPKAFLIRSVPAFICILILIVDMHCNGCDIAKLFHHRRQFYALH